MNIFFHPCWHLLRSLCLIVHFVNTQSKWFYQHLPLLLSHCSYPCRSSVICSCFFMLVPHPDAYVKALITGIWRWSPLYMIKCEWGCKSGALMIGSARLRNTRELCLCLPCEVVRLEFNQKLILCKAGSEFCGEPGNAGPLVWEF